MADISVEARIEGHVGSWVSQQLCELSGEGAFSLEQLVVHTVETKVGELSQLGRRDAIVPSLMGGWQVVTAIRVSRIELYCPGVNRRSSGRRCTLGAATVMRWRVKESNMQVSKKSEGNVLSRTKKKNRAEQ